MVNEGGAKVDIERTCVNCEYAMDLNWSSCAMCETCRESFTNFEPRKDLVELHGKLRKAVEALRKIKDSDAGCEILWQVKDTDGSWYDVHVKDYISDVLEELQ